MLDKLKQNIKPSFKMQVTQKNESKQITGFMLKSIIT